MIKKRWKLIVKGIVYLAVFVLFAWLLSFLKEASETTTDDKMTWEPDAKTEAAEGFELAAENTAFRLYFDPAAVQFIVEDKQTNEQWRSNPENAASDPVAFGQNKTLVRSLMDISYTDDQSNYYTVNSFAGSVQDKTYTYEYKDNGIYINLQFAKQGFEIPCFFGIEDDRFVARILSDQIQQHGKLMVAGIAFLPFFGAGSLEDEGYLLVPDGSGALIYFNNQKQTYQAYSQKVYGRNLALNLQTSSIVTKDATMPVFGIKKSNGAMLGVITEGEYQAEVKAEVARKTTANNIAYSNILFIQNENNTLLAGSDKEEVTTMTSPQHNNFPYYEVSYFFLKSGSGYSEMAARYHNYLVAEKGMQEVAPGAQKRANLSFLGGIRVRDTFLGVPYYTVKALTSFNSLKDTADALTKEVGNNFQVSMTYLEKGGSQGKIATKVSFESNLGGKSAYKKLVSAMDAAGIPFYPVYDPISIRKSGNGYRAQHGVRNVSRAGAIQYAYRLPTGEKNSDKNSYYLISPKYIGKIVTSLTKSATSNGMTRLGLLNLGNKTYADYRSNSISDNEAGQYWEDALKTVSDSQELLLVGAYAYTFPYVDVITDAPVYSSQFDMEDESVPFYQMVVGTSAWMYSEPVNVSGNVREMFLKTVEYGVAPTFQLMTADRNALQDSEYQEYYAACYGDWKDQIQGMLQELGSLDGVLGTGVVAHEKLDEKVYSTTYKNGTIVYVNYSNQAVTINGVEIPAMGFARKGEK